MKNEDVYHFHKPRNGIGESLFSPKVLLEGYRSVLLATTF